MILYQTLLFLILCGICSSEINDAGPDEAASPQQTEEGQSSQVDKLSVVEQVLEDFEQSIQESQAVNSVSTSRDEPVAVEEEGGGGEGEGEGGSSGKSEHQKPKIVRTRVNCIQLSQQIVDAYLEENSSSADEYGAKSGRLVLINGTELQVKMSEETNANVTNRTAPGICSVILFYGNWCQFSASAAPSFNALPRFFPRLNFYAIEVANNLNIFSQYAVVALPSVLVFHNGKPVYGFNNSIHNLETYVQFISNYTGIKPVQDLAFQLIEKDYEGPVPNTIVERFNYNLLLAYLFILLCLLVNLSKSSYVRNLTDTLRNLWREVEIQHEHAD